MHQLEQGPCYCSSEEVRGNGKQRACIGFCTPAHASIVKNQPGWAAIARLQL